MVWIRFFLIIVCFCFRTLLFSQIIDSIRVSIHNKARFTCGLSTRYSFITGIKAPIFSAKLGVEFGHKFRVGGGISALEDNTPLYKYKYIPNSIGKIDSIKSSLRFNYFCYYVEYVFYKTKHWEFSIPLQMGIGNSRYEYVYSDTLRKENEKIVILYEPVIAGQYKIFDWFGFGANIGYRLMIVNNKAIQQNFNSPIYSFSMLIFYGELYKKLFPRTKLAEMID